MTSAPLPFLTEADPDRLGEGSLDPLGLASIADRLADEIAPSVTARMIRIRFITAIATGALLGEELADWPASGGQTTPYLAYEWHVVEALARRRASAETQGVPGIQKARRAITRANGAHLDAASYLQTPKVFGFHGVYKRLARSLGVVDEALILMGPGDELLHTWEREQRFQGYSDRLASSDGGRLARTLLVEVREALARGRVTTSPGSHLWTKLADALQPDGMGRRERHLLWTGLIDEREPMRRELVTGLRQLGQRDSEADALRALAVGASAPMRARLRAIETYEHVARLVTNAFQAMRVASTGQGTKPVPPSQLTEHWAVREASTRLPDAMARAAYALDPLGQGAELERVLGRFAEPHRPADLVDAILDHHEAIQAAKSLGKRPWLERAGIGFYVRDAYRTGDEPLDDAEYLHPYRVQAISTFIADLWPAG